MKLLAGDWILRWALLPIQQSHPSQIAAENNKPSMGYPQFQKVALKVTVQQMYPTVQKSKQQTPNEAPKDPVSETFKNKKDEHMPSKYIQRNNREERMKKVR